MQKFHHDKLGYIFTTVCTNRAEMFIPHKRVENNHVIDNYSQSGLKMINHVFALEKQIDKYLSRKMLNKI